MAALAMDVGTLAQDMVVSSASLEQQVASATQNAGAGSSSSTGGAGAIPNFPALNAQQMAVRYCTSIV